MAPTTGDNLIEHAYLLLRTYGPATAYDFMQQAGGLQNFPPSLLMQVSNRLQEIQAMHQPGARSHAWGAGLDRRRFRA